MGGIIVLRPEFFLVARIGLGVLHEKETYVVAMNIGYGEAVFSSGGGGTQAAVSFARQDTDRWPFGNYQCAAPHSWPLQATSANVTSGLCKATEAAGGAGGTRRNRVVVNFFHAKATAPPPSMVQPPKDHW